MKRYQKYKPSGIEWLGDIPEHWEVKRVKDISSKIGSGITPNGGAEVYQVSGIPFLRSQNIQNNRLLLDDIAYISEEVDSKMANSRIRPNDVLLNVTGASIGRCFYVPEDFKRGNVNQHVCIIRPKRKSIQTKNLHYEFISQFGQIFIDLSQNGANREGLNFQQIKNFLFLIPPLPEQTAIASYLDAKTAAIDRKMELLTTKANKYKALRRSLINETVCRGLNPNAPLKDSGIEWIGMIPEHWEVKRVKEVFQLNPNLGIKKPMNGSLVSFVPMECLRCGMIERRAIEFSEAFSYVPFKNDDILMAKVTPCFENGNIAIAENLENGIGFGSSEIFVIRNNKSQINTRLAFYMFQSDYFREIGISSMKGTGGLKRVDPTTLVCSLYPLPPLSEQTTIANYLDTKTTQIDTIISNIGEQIGKLTQLRKTLINDVVTGKIKVTE